MNRSFLVLAFAFVAATPAHAMTASFSWKDIPRCSGVSPAFSISDAPKGTAALRFSMRDYDAPNFQHGGSTIAWTRGRVPQGAISYIGPCPPGAETHRYIWKIEALDASGEVLIAITSSAAYPP